MDIVERLRNRMTVDFDAEGEIQDVPDKECIEAADEIERLREERNRLRKALQEIADSCEGWGQFAEDTLKEGE